MDISNVNNKVKDNWDDSSESESEYEYENKNENGRDVNKYSIDPFDELSSKCDENKDDDIEDDDDIEGEWDFYDGYTACINCGKSSNQRIIMIESKRVFCYDACLENGNDDYDDYDDDYDELGEYDKKLGLSVSCR